MRAQHWLGVVLSLQATRVGASRVRALAPLAALSLLSGVRARRAYPSGTVVGWGDNAFHQTNVPANATNVVALAGGFYHGLALLELQMAQSSGQWLPLLVLDGAPGTRYHLETTGDLPATNTGQRTLETCQPH
jgi:hypothetical protein